MPNYCKKCGYVFGDEYYVPRLVQKGICPTCRNKLFETKEPISYFQGRVEKSMPTWEDVVRHKYLKNITLDTHYSNVNINNEKRHYEQELNKLKNNSNNIPTKPIITCPYCQSTNTKKIGVVGRSVSFGLFGFGSSKMGKQWHCNRCGSDF